MKKDVKQSGRPKAKINWEEVDNFLIAGCSGAEIAGYLGLNKATVYDRCEKDNGISFSKYSQQKKAKGDSMLRARQYQEAMDGDKSLLIWLGKNRLGQTDKQEMNATIKTEQPLFGEEE